MRRETGDSKPRVLYVSHTGVVGGAERALLDHLSLMSGSLSPAGVMCPPGELAEELRSEGITPIAFRGTTASLRFTVRGLAHAAREFSASAFSIHRAAKKTGADVIHANSIRAGLLALLANLAGGPPVVVHVHDVLPDGFVVRRLQAWLLHRSAALIAVSSFARTAFLASRPTSDVPFLVLTNPIDATQLLAEAPERAAARRAVDVPQDVPLLGIVGQITPWKAQDTAIRALARVIDDVPNVRLLIVGEPRFTNSTRYANQAYKSELEDLVGTLGLTDAVTFCGHRSDIPAVMRALDILLLPSWTEPLSRAMLEAMVLGTPVIATTQGGPTEFIFDGDTGYLAPPREPDTWARVITAVLQDRAGRARVAERAHLAALSRLDLESYVAQMVSLYERVTA